MGLEGITIHDRAQLTIIKLTSGKYGYVGTVPVKMAYKYADTGQPVSDCHAGTIARCGVGLIKDQYGIVDSVFDTSLEAYQFALASGYEPRIYDR